MNKLTKLPPSWHAEAITLLRDNFTAIHNAFLDSTKKAVWLGIFLNQIKLRGKEDKSIPHGEFLPWLAKALPDLDARAAQRYMLLATNLCEKGKCQIRQNVVFGDGLQLPTSILKLIEGKTQNQLLLEFKQVELDGDELRVKRGRLKGAGGREPEPQGSILANLEFHRKYSLRKMGLADKALTAMGTRWIAQPDGINEAFLGTLERTARCIREWLSTPPARRDEKTIETLFHKTF